MDKDFNSSSEQFPELTAQNATSVSVVQQSDVKLGVTKKIKKRSIASLVVGVIVLVGLLLPFIIFGNNSNNPAVSAILYLIYAPIYLFAYSGGSIVCAVLLILILIDMKKYRIKFSKYVTMAIVGFILTFSPCIYSGIRTAIIASDPFKITAGDMSTYGCVSSARRARNEHWSDVNSLGGDPKYIAEDIACSYLEYYFDNDEEPFSSTQLSQYYQSYNAKNGVATITINAEQPDKENIYNIITHRSCTYDDTNNNSAISVWFRVEEKNNGIGCIDITAKDYTNNETKRLNLYDLEESKEWLAWQFEEIISSDEAREIIESKRKEQGDNSWTTGSVEVNGKSRDGYYWIKYEEIKNNGTTTKLNALFYYDDGVWVFEIPESDYDFNKHSFKSF